LLLIGRDIAKPHYVTRPVDTLDRGQTGLVWDVLVLFLDPK
jgi:hypothetical protein